MRNVERAKEKSDLIGGKPARAADWEVVSEIGQGVVPQRIEPGGIRPIRFGDPLNDRFSRGLYFHFAANNGLSIGSCYEGVESNGKLRPDGL